MSARSFVRRCFEIVGRPPGALVTWGVLAVGVITAVAGSTIVGPSLDELPRVAAAERGRDLIWALVETGPSALRSSSAVAAYRAFDGLQSLPVLVSSWARLSLGEAGAIDALTAARFGWLLVTALGLLGVYWIGRAARGARFGVFAAGLLWVTPRWAHGSATADEAVVVTSLALFVLGAYINTVARPEGQAARRRVCSAAAAAIWLGIALAISLSAVWVVGLIVVHAMLTTPGPLRSSLHRGRFPVPSMFIWALVLTGPVLLLLSPELWRASPPHVVRWALGPIGDAVSSTVYRGTVVGDVPVPRIYAADWVVSTTPLALLTLAAVGAARETALWRRADRRSQSGVRLGALCASGLVFAVVWPAVAPVSLAGFPPRGEIALPFIALMAAEGLETVRRQLPVRFREPVAIGMVGLLAVGAVGHLPTAGSDFSVVVGGTRRVAATERFVVGDGSEVAALAPNIDALGEPVVRIHSPVPQAYWDVMHDAGRLQARVEDVRSERRADVVMVRGHREGAWATVSHGDAVLWSAMRR